MISIPIKPLSVNEAWKGKRYKTPIYKSYEQAAWIQMPPFEIQPGKIHLILIFGYSNAGADIDNAVKPFLDILQARHGFNDNRIYRLTVDKQITAKGKEFVAYHFKPYTQELEL